MASAVGCSLGVVPTVLQPRIVTMKGGARRRRALISQRQKLGLDGVSPHRSCKEGQSPAATKENSNAPSGAYGCLALFHGWRRGLSSAATPWLASVSKKTESRPAPCKIARSDFQNGSKGRARSSPSRTTWALPQWHRISPVPLLWSRLLRRIDSAPARHKSNVGNRSGFVLPQGPARPFAV